MFETRRFIAAVLLACTPIMFGCEDEKDDGPCGGCSTSRTISPGGEIPGELTTRAQGSIVVDDDGATFDVTDPWNDVDANPFRLVFFAGAVVVYRSTAPSGEPTALYRIAFDDALSERGISDVALVMRVQGCRVGVLAFDDVAASCLDDRGRSPADDLPIRGTLDVRETSPRHYALDVTIDARARGNLARTELHGP